MFFLDEIVQMFEKLDVLAVMGWMSDMVTNSRRGEIGGDPRQQSRHHTTTHKHVCFEAQSQAGVAGPPSIGQREGDTEKLQPGQPARQRLRMPAH